MALGAIQAAAEVTPHPHPRPTEKAAIEKEPERRSSRPREAAPMAGVGEVTVTTDSDVETFVYLNGGSLLGRAPIQGAAIPAGKQTLVFWSPSIGGRSTRRIDMRPGQNVTLIHSIAPRGRFSPSLEGG